MKTLLIIATLFLCSLAVGVPITPVSNPKLIGVLDVTGLTSVKGDIPGLSNTTRLPLYVSDLTALGGYVAANYKGVVAVLTSGAAYESASTDGGSTWTWVAKIIGNAAAVRADLSLDKVILFCASDTLADGMNHGIGVVGYAFHIIEIRAVHVGSGLSNPSVLLKIYHGTDRSAGTAVVTSGTTVTSSTGGDSAISFDSPACAAQEWLWFTSSNRSGSTDKLEIVIIGTYD